MIGIAVVGGGRIGVMHARIVARTAGAKLTGVVVRSQKRELLDAAGLQSATMFGGIEDALADKKTDAVLIAASTDSHIELIRAAVAAGKNVLCEKPVSLSSANIAALHKECGGKAIVQVGYNRRFDPAFARLREMAQRGDAGRLYMLTIVNMDPRRPPMEFIPRSGGMFCDFNSHDFDMLAYIGGEPLAEVYARGANLVDEEIGKLGDIDTAVISGKMRGGALAAVLSSRETNYGYDQRVEVLGEKGGLRVGNIAAHGVAADSSLGSLYAGPKYDFIARYQESYELQTAAFLEAINGGQSIAAGLPEAAAAAKCSEAAQQSMEQNRPVAVGEI